MITPPVACSLATHAPPAMTASISATYINYIIYRLSPRWAPKDEQVSGLRPRGAEEVTVSFHNFKSQKIKLSVSNPKNKSVAYVSVLSQISNCQGLGRKNKHETLKTDPISIIV